MKHQSRFPKYKTLNLKKPTKERKQINFNFISNQFSFRKINKFYKDALKGFDKFANHYNSKEFYR